MVYLIHFDKPLKHAQHYSVGKSSLTEAPMSMRNPGGAERHRSFIGAVITPS